MAAWIGAASLAMRDSRLALACVCAQGACLRQIRFCVTEEYKSADIQSVGPQGKNGAELQDGQPGPASFTAAPRRLHPRLHPDAQEAEFGVAQGGARAPDERNRSDNVYSRRRPQPAGALDCADPRGPRE